MWRWDGHARAGWVDERGTHLGGGVEAGMGTHLGGGAEAGRMDMSTQTQAYLYAILTVFLWSTAATAFKLSLRVLDPIQLLFYAVLTSVIVLGIILGAQGKWAAVFLCTRRQYLQSLGLGMLNPCAYYLVLLQAYDLLPAQEAQPLNYTWAIALAAVVHSAFEPKS